MLGIPLGLLAANATEWFVHKHVLHGIGRKKSSFWSFHWHEHHRESRRHEMHDPALRAVCLWHSFPRKRSAGAGAWCGRTHAARTHRAPSLWAPCGTRRSTTTACISAHTSIPNGRENTSAGITTTTWRRTKTPTGVSPDHGSTRSWEHESRMWGLHANPWTAKNVHASKCAKQRRQRQRQRQRVR